MSDSMLLLTDHTGHPLQIKTWESPLSGKVYVYLYCAGCGHDLWHFGAVPYHLEEENE